MWKAIISAFVIASCAAGCDQQPRQQQDARVEEVPKQLPNDAEPLDPNRFEGRDGREEAQAAIAAGNTPKLYAHVFNGVVPGWKTPGIVGCGPNPNDVVRFELIDELNFSEGSDIPRPHAPNAYSFAADFNREMFKASERKIRQVCPSARLE
jgi:hypothetical protein